MHNSESIGLAKKVIGVFPLHLLENPERTFSPSFYQKHSIVCFKWVICTEYELCFDKAVQDFPGAASGKEPSCQSWRHKETGLDPWVGKIPWRRAWQPTPAFSPGESHGQRSLVGSARGVAKSGAGHSAHTKRFKGLRDTERRPVLLEQRPQIHHFADSLGDLPGNALHERNHPLVFVVVAGDNPHHPQGAHHGGDCFQDNVKARSVRDVLTGEVGANERARQAGSVSGRPV